MNVVVAGHTHGGGRADEAIQRCPPADGWLLCERPRSDGCEIKKSDGKGFFNVPEFEFVLYRDMLKRLVPGATFLGVQLVPSSYGRETRAVIYYLNPGRKP